MIEAPPRPVEAPVEKPLLIEVVEPMSASMAMRIGSLTTRQIKRQSMDSKGGACALGAMMIGFGHDLDTCGEVVTLMTNTLMTAPCGHNTVHYGGTLNGVIAHLNDDDDWTREQIADWMESILWQFYRQLN